MARLTAQKTIALALFVGYAAACGGAGGPSSTPAIPAPGPRGREVASNVLFSDYAGTHKCASCHAGHVQSWLRSPMHNMTREASALGPTAVRGPFDGTVFRFKSDTARLETVG